MNLTQYQNICTILVTLGLDNIFTLGLDDGSDMSSSDGSFDYSNDGKPVGSLLGVSVG